MIDNSYDAELKERAFMLLFGLLDESEAEELRTRVATDARIGQIFESVRADLEILRRASLADATPSLDSAPTKNISVESSSFDVSPSFPIEAKSDFYALASSPATVFPADDGTQSSKAKKRLKRATRRQSPLPGDLSFDARKVKRSNRRFFMKSLAYRALRIIHVVGGLPQSTLIFTCLLISIAVATTLAIRAQNVSFQKYFRNDFRIRVAVPQVLVRGASQSIVAITTGLGGNPKRAPIRFCFDDPSAGDFIFAHTESGAVDGRARCDLPDLSDFPDSTALTIYAGADDRVARRMTLSVVDFDVARKSRRYDWTRRISNLDAQETTKVALESPRFSPYFENVFETLVRETRASLALRPETESSQNLEINDSDELTAPFRVYLFPEVGRLVANFSNRVVAYCVDANGRPAAKRMSLREIGAETKIPIETSVDGACKFDWNLVEDAAYSLELDHASDEETFEPETTTFENARAPMFFDFDPSQGRVVAKFVPCATTTQVVFALESRTLSSDESVKIRFNASSKRSLLIAIERDGVVVAEQFATAPPGSSNTEIELPNDALGVLKTCVYDLSPDGATKIGESYFFRRARASVDDFHAVAKRDGETHEIVLTTSAKNYRQTSRGNRSYWNELPMTLEAYWAESLADGVAKLELDEALQTLDDSAVEIAALTIMESCEDNPPIVFDNLASLKESTREKLKHYGEYESQTRLNIVRLCFFGCIALALAALYFVLFKSFSFLRGATFAICACLLATFISDLQKSFTATQRSAFELMASIEDEPHSASNARQPLRSAQKDAQSLRSNSVSSDAESVERTPVATRKIKQGATTILADELFDADKRNRGFAVFKLFDGETSLWRIASLEEGDEESDEEIE